MKRAIEPKLSTAKGKKTSPKVSTSTQGRAGPAPAPWWMWAALVGLSFLAYANSLENYFVMDDKFQILMNQTLKDPSYWPKYFTTTVWEFIDKMMKGNYYRPLFMLAYWMLYQSFELNSSAYHFTSVLLHTFNVLMIFILVNKIFRDRWLAFVSALLFAVHSIHSEAVHWIAALGDLQCLAFLLLALWCYQRTERRAGRGFWVWSLLSAAMLFGALLSKEMAITFIGVIVLYEHLWRNPEPLRDLRAHLRGALAYVPHLIVTGIYVLLRFRIVGGFSVSGDPESKMSPFTFIMTNLSLQGRYWWKLLFPYPLRFWYPRQQDLITNWFAPTVWLSIAFLIGAAVLLIRLRAHRRVLLACLLWVTVMLSPAMNLTGIGPNFFTERYLYIPSVGFCVLMAYGWVKLRALKWGKPGSTLSAPKVATALLALFVLLHTAQLWARSRYFSDDVTFYRRELKFAPDAAFLHFWLGNAYFDMGEYLFRQGYHDRAMGEFDQAFEQYQITLRCPEAQKGTLAMTHLNLGNVYGRRKQFKQAVEEYKKSIAVVSREPRTHYLLAYTYMQLGRYDEARRALQESLRIRPSFPESLQLEERNTFMQMMQQLNLSTSNRASG